MHHRQSVHKDSDIIARAVLSFCGRILMNDLQTILEDMFLVNQFDVLEAGVIFADELQLCRAVILQQFRFVSHSSTCIGYLCAEETFPFIIRERDMVQFFQLLTEISHQLILGMDVQILIPLVMQLLDECIFQLRFALISDAL